MKLNSDQIKIILMTYQKYEILWDIKHVDHTIKSEREKAFENFLEELRCVEGFQTIDMVTLKTKLKTIKTVYRQELNKISKSKINSSGLDDLYIPKLIWFATADSFLNAVTRLSKNNMVLQNSEKEGEIDVNMALDFSMLDDFNSEETATINTKDIMPTARRKRHKSNSSIDTVIDVLKEMVANNEKPDEDEYESFGKHIVQQLKQLPVRSFISLQSEIQQLISKERLLCLQQPSSTTDLPRDHSK